MTNEICLPITVIVPTFNDGDYLSEAINSILIQTSPPEMLIVVDDGSFTNDAEMTVNEFKKDEELITQIVYLKQANKGPSAARNAGLQMVKSPYVTFLDADDRMLPGNLASMWKAMVPLADDYFGVYGTHCDRVTRKPYAYGNLDGCVAANKVGRKRGVAGGVHSYLFRTHYLIAIEGFDESLVNNEDYDLIIRLLRLGLKCKGKVTTCFEKRNRLGSLSRPWQPSQALEHTLKFLRKAEHLGYFPADELETRRRGAQLSYAKRLMEQGKNDAARETWRETLQPFPRTLREYYHWLLYLYLRLKH